MVPRVSKYAQARYRGRADKAHGGEQQDDHHEQEHDGDCEQADDRPIGDKRAQEKQHTCQNEGRAKGHLSGFLSGIAARLRGAWAGWASYHSLKLLSLTGMRASDWGVEPHDPDLASGGVVERQPAYLMGSYPLPTYTCVDLECPVSDLKACHVSRIAGPDGSVPVEPVAIDLGGLPQAQLLRPEPLVVRMRAVGAPQDQHAAEIVVINPAEPDEGPLVIPVPLVALQPLALDALTLDREVRNERG